MVFRFSPLLLTAYLIGLIEQVMSELFWGLLEDRLFELSTTLCIVRRSFKANMNGRECRCRMSVDKCDLLLT